MNLTRIFFFSILCVSILASCSIDKRLYRNGFYIDNRGEKINSSTASALPVSPKHEQPKTSGTKTSSSKTESAILPAPTENTPADSSAAPSQQQHEKKNSCSAQQSLHKTPTPPPGDTTSSSKKTDPLLIGAVLLFLLGILMISFSFLFASFLLAGLPVFVLASLVCAIIALHRINTQPDVYTGKMLAIICLVVDVIIVAVIVRFIIALTTGQ